MRFPLLPAAAVLALGAAACLAVGISSGLADDDQPDVTHGGLVPDLSAEELERGIDWAKDLATAEALAAESKRPLMVVFR